ncbi:MAG: aldo/keto reductase [Bacteroidales bacterium]
MTTQSLVKKLGLGTVQFGLDYGISNSLGPTPGQEVKRLLEYAAGKGIDLLDTAAAYGNSQEVLGRQELSSFRLVSKFLYDGHTDILSLLQSSLRALSVSSLYAYLAHRPLQMLEYPHYWEQLQDLKRSGDIGKLGFSFDTPEEADKVLQAGLQPDLVQLPYNYLDHRFESLMQELHQQGCEIHARSPFLQGLFFVDPGELPAYFDGIRELLAGLQQYGDALRGALLKYAAEQPYIDKVIFGVNSLDQFRQNLDSLSTAPDLPLLDRTVDPDLITPSKWPKR